MKPYSEYTAEELAMERLFIRWVRDPDDPRIAKFWLDWLRHHPHQAGTVEAAKALVDSVSDWENSEMSDEEGVSLWKLIQKTIGSLPFLHDSEKTDCRERENRVFLKWIMGIGATVVVVFFLFIKDTKPYEDNQESRNALAAPFDPSGYPDTDSTRIQHYPDSTLNYRRIK